MKTETDKLNTEIEELKRKLQKSDYECKRLGSLVDRLTKEIENLEKLMDLNR